MSSPKSAAVLPSDRDSYSRAIPHDYAFDPTHGYTFAQLLEVNAPEEPANFADFWREKYQRAMRMETILKLRDTGRVKSGHKVFEMSYTSTDAIPIRGWLLIPESGNVRRGLVVGHGYGGRDAPEEGIPIDDAAILFPCARGLGVSRVAGISPDAHWHVRHNLQSKNRYVLGGCVEDVWLAASALLHQFPQVAGHLGYMGTSFGGGIGALAMAWDRRFQRAHFCVPSFGNQPLRLQLPSVGSALSVQGYVANNPKTLQVLSYHDAAVAAKYIQMPVHCACALFDPAVAPAGQFSIFNAIPGEKHLFVLAAGHHSHARENEEGILLQREIHNFFLNL